MISVLVLTKNEQQDLPGCLESVSWSDDVHVLDSLSTDDTIAIAETFGAKVTKRAFDNWSSHQNWALRNIAFRHEWVFYIDADERVSEQLRENCLQAVNSPGHYSAFRVQRRDFWGDTQLKHVQASAFYVRLFRPEQIRYERLVNPVTIVDGECGDVAGYLDHYPFSKGVSHWLDRHNSYSTFEAEESAGSLYEQNWSARGLFDSDFHVRRRHQKALFYRLPFRPLLKFIVLYFIKLGFLDGAAGFRYAILQSYYEYMIVLKTREIRATVKRDDD